MILLVVIIIVVVVAGGGGGGDGPQPEPSPEPFTSSVALQSAVEQYLTGGIADAERTYGPISTWDVSQVEDFEYLFDAVDRVPGAASFNQDLSQWDTARATSMVGMFRGAASFNQNLDAWSVKRVTDFSFMFAGATAFNGAIGGWEISSGTTFRGMFDGATSFNQDISEWPISDFTSSILGMFNGASSFAQDLCPWGTKLKATVRVEGAFQSTACPEQADPNLTADPVTPLCFACFASPTSSPTLSPTRFPTLTTSPTGPTHSPTGRNCPATGKCFASTPELIGAVELYLQDPTGGLTCDEYGHPIDNWCVSQITDFTLVFGQGARQTFNEPIGSWDVSNGVQFAGMFENNGVFNQ